VRVQLIAPSNEDSTYIKPLWACTLAAHTPEDVEVTLRDDGLEPIDLAREEDAPDLVGISVNSKTAARAYAIADAYRARGSKVVLGGIHVTALPEEGLEHADAVVAGEAEWLWQKVVEDAKAGKLGRHTSLLSRGIYKHAEWPALSNLPRPKRDLQLTREELRAGWVRAWRSMYSLSSIARRYDFGLDHSWIQNLAYWPFNLLMHELAERKIAKGDRSFRKHRAVEFPFGL